MKSASESAVEAGRDDAPGSAPRIADDESAPRCTTGTAVDRSYDFAGFARAQGPTTATFCRNSSRFRARSRLPSRTALACSIAAALTQLFSDKGLSVTGLVFLFLALLFLSVAVSVWRIVTLPRRVARGVRSVRTAVGVVQQRQADKAAGKPVAPINVLAIAGIVLAFGGIIVARTASAIIGLGMIVIGMGVMLIGTRLYQAEQSRTQHGGDPQLQNGWNPGPGVYGAPPTIAQTTPDWSAAFGTSPSVAGLSLQPIAPVHSHSPYPAQDLPGSNAAHRGNSQGSSRFNTPPNWPPNPPGWAPGPDWRPDSSWPPAPPGWQFWT